jgi:Family of unknown function (DUF6951)
VEATAHVQAGICGHQTTMRAKTDDGRRVTFAVETTCDNVKRFAARLAAEDPVDAYREINPRGASDVLARGHEAGCCTDCIVPASGLKALRVATDLALPGDAAIGIMKD